VLAVDSGREEKACESAEMINGRSAEADAVPVLQPGALAVSAVEKPEALRWPAALPDPRAAEAAVASALSARLADAGALVTRVAAEVSEIERAAFDGLALADPQILRTAAGLRLRLATALETAPSSGEFDAGAVQALLAGADEVLAALAQESAAATEQVASAIGTIRTDLVRDAIRVSEAHQRLANPQGAQAPAAAPAAPQVRLLSNESEDVPAVRERSRRGIGLWVVLGLAVLAAGGYHVNRAYETKRATASMIRVDGAPERVIASVERAKGQVLFTPPDAPLSDAELQQLRTAQEARGRTVTVRAPGVYVLQKADGR
jgi:hypothetical protein